MFKLITLSRSELTTTSENVGEIRWTVSRAIVAQALLASCMLLDIPACVHLTIENIFITVKLEDRRRSTQANISRKRYKNTWPWLYSEARYKVIWRSRQFLKENLTLEMEGVGNFTWEPQDQYRTQILVKFVLKTAATQIKCVSDNKSTVSSNISVAFNGVSGRITV